jgi:hypothetical protein
MRKFSSSPLQNRIDMWHIVIEMYIALNGQKSLFTTMTAFAHLVVQFRGVGPSTGLPCRLSPISKFNEHYLATNHPSFGD